MCETSEGENCRNCLSDCGACQFVCGNGVCFNSENCAICRRDCGHFAPKDMLASLNSVNSPNWLCATFHYANRVFPLQSVGRMITSQKKPPPSKFSTLFWPALIADQQVSKNRNSSTNLLKSSTTSIPKPNISKATNASSQTFCHAHQHR